MAPRCFSIEEANAVLPQLESLLTRLMAKKEAHERLHDEHFFEELIHDAMRQKKSDSGNPSLETGAREVDGGVTDLQDEIDQIRALGCFLRNLERGWVEFPAERQGETIYYCWKRGESRVEYYRTSKAIFTERFRL